MSNRAILFDMDDTLVRTAPLWRAAEEVLLRAVGHHYDRELAAKYKGMNAPDIGATVYRELRPPLSKEQCQAVMRDALIDQYRAQPVTAMPGACELVRALQGRYPLAVASGSPMEGIETALKQLGIIDCFDVVLSSETVSRGKPHPDVFFAAEKKLRESLNLPENELLQCVVIEDSTIGVQAALGANMPVLAVPSTDDPRTAELATQAFASLTGVSVEAVAELFNERD